MEIDLSREETLPPPPTGKDYSLLNSFMSDRQITQFKVVQNPLFKNFLIILNTYYAVVMWAIWFFSLQ